MVDVVDKETRSRMMQNIKAVSRLEHRVVKALWKRGFRFRRNVRDLMGKPDISVKKYKAVVFIDSCFWHRCSDHCKIPKSNSEFWLKKLERNKERDDEVNLYYRDKNWSVFRVWEHELKEDFDAAIDRIAYFLEKEKHKVKMHGKESS